MHRRTSAPSLLAAAPSVRQHCPQFEL